MSGFVDDFNEDIDPDLMDELGDDVRFIDGRGFYHDIKGAFRDAYYEANRNTETTTPAIECLDCDVCNADGGRIIRAGITYDIIRVEPDGTGISLLILRHAG